MLKALKLDQNVQDIELEVKDGQSTGIAIMYFDSEENADQAAEALDRFKFAKYILTSISAKKFEDIFALKAEQTKSNYLK